MPSDAYMKLSGIKGETKDAMEGQWGAFEIATFSFKVTAEGDDKDGSKSNQAATATPAKQPTKTKETRHGTFTIKKSLDYASPDLFRRCADNKQPIDWAIVYFRETGDPNQIPYLVLEFTNLQVSEFDWELDPAQSGDAAAQVESVTFDFDTILIKYAPQTMTGEHMAAHLNLWNFAKHNDDVQELPQDAFLGEVNEV